jgi:uncharacterized protein (UPF0276 family)
MHPSSASLAGTVGLGFRVALAEQLLAAEQPPLSFLEIAPENYLGVGGRRGRHLAMAIERWPIVCHGLCGDFAGAGPVDEALLADLKALLRRVGSAWYSDHLCFTHVAGGESHELLPLPFTLETVERVAARVRLVRDRLEVPVAVENVSAYLRVPTGTGGMDEATFINAVVDAADCGMLLDVNNVYVNAINFGVDPVEALLALPLERTLQIHIAGHHVERRDDDGTPRLLVDTHGAAIVDPVYALLEVAVDAFARREVPMPPVLLERDHNIPPLPELFGELRRIRSIVDGERA